MPRGTVSDDAIEIVIGTTITRALPLDPKAEVWPKAEVLWRYATAIFNEDCTSWKADAYRWQEAAGLTIPSLGDWKINQFASLVGALPSQRTLTPRYHHDNLRYVDAGIDAPWHKGLWPQRQLQASSLLKSLLGVAYAVLTKLHIEARGLSRRPAFSAVAPELLHSFRCNRLDVQFPKQ